MFDLLRERPFILGIVVIGALVMGAPKWSAAQGGVPDGLEVGQPYRTDAYTYTMWACAGKNYTYRRFETDTEIRQTASSNPRVAVAKGQSNPAAVGFRANSPGRTTITFQARKDKIVTGINPPPEDQSFTTVTINLIVVNCNQNGDQQANNQQGNNQQGGNQQGGNPQGGNQGGNQGGGDSGGLPDGLDAGQPYRTSEYTHKMWVCVGKTYTYTRFGTDTEIRQVASEDPAVATAKGRRNPAAIGIRANSVGTTTITFEGRKDKIYAGINPPPEDTSFTTVTIQLVVVDCGDGQARQAGDQQQANQGGQQAGGGNQQPGNGDSQGVPPGLEDGDPYRTEPFTHEMWLCAGQQYDYSQFDTDTDIRQVASSNPAVAIAGGESNPARIAIRANTPGTSTVTFQARRSKIHAGINPPPPDESFTTVTIQVHVVECASQQARAETIDEGGGAQRQAVLTRWSPGVEVGLVSLGGSEFQNLGTGPGIELTAARNVAPNWVLRGGLALASPGMATERGDGDMSLVGLVAESRYRLDLEGAGPLQPFVGGRLGLYRRSQSFTYEERTATVQQDLSGTGLGLQARLGSAYRVAPSIVAEASLGLGVLRFGGLSGTYTGPSGTQEIDAPSSSGRILNLQVGFSYRPR